MLPWPRTAEDGTPIGFDLAAPGLTSRTKTIADDVRHLVLARFRDNAARLLGPDDLVQEVYRRIIRRNPRPCAFDPRQGSFGTYMYRVTSGAIVDMLKPAKRRVEHELLSVNSDEHPEPAAPEPDPDAAPLDPCGERGELHTFAFAGRCSSTPWASAACGGGAPAYRGRSPDPGAATRRAPRCAALGRGARADAG